MRNVGLMDDSNEWGDSTLYDTKVRTISMMIPRLFVVCLPTSHPQRKKKNEQSSDQLKQRAVAEQKRQASIADSCWFCYENPKIEKVPKLFPF